MSPVRRKHPSPAKRIGWIAGYVCIRLLLTAGSIMPFGLMRPLARLLRIVLGPAVAGRRRVVRENLSIAFPKAGENFYERTLRELEINSLVLFCECARLARLTPGELRASVECTGDAKRLLAEAVSGRRGTILATVHFGNWEWAAAWVAQSLEEPFGVVYKPLHNPLADKLLQGRRRKLGFRLFSTRDPGLIEMTRFIRRGGVLGILSDQDAGRRGTFIPFFGRPASTPAGMARMAQRLGSDSFFIVNTRIAPGRFKLESRPLPQPDPILGPEEGAAEIMAAYHACLEEFIRRDPAQYFWWHRRWRSQPKQD